MKFLLSLFVGLIAAQKDAATTAAEMMKNKTEIEPCWTDRPDLCPKDTKCYGRYVVYANKESPAWQAIFAMDSTVDTMVLSFWCINAEWEAKAK